jgi:hypothetical protein
VSAALWRDNSVTGAKHRKTRPTSDAIEWKDYPRISPGEYRAYCKWGKQYRDPGLHRWTCLLRWDVLSEDLERVLACVPQWFPLGSRDKPRASRRGKYLPEWIRANGGPPVRKDRLSPGVFVCRMARVEVGDTAGPAPYSVVRRVLEWETGSPGHSVSKSHSQGRPLVSNVESEAFERCLSRSGASARAGVEGEHTPAHTQGAGEQETANPPKARKPAESTAQHTGLYIRRAPASARNQESYKDA